MESPSAQGTDGLASKGSERAECNTMQRQGELVSWGGHPVKTPSIKIKAAQTSERPSKTKLAFKRSAGFLPGHFGSLFARLGKADCDGLLTTLYRAALATFSRFERSALFPVHRALNTSTGGVSVSTSPGCATRTGCH